MAHPDEPHHARDDQGPTPHHTLGPRDRAAIDALVASGFSPKPDAPRAQRAASLLRLLRAGPAPDDALVDVTLAAVQRAAQDEARAQRNHGPDLSPASREALDALMSAAGQPSKVPGELRPRAAKAAALAELVASAHAPALGKDLLIERTMRTIQSVRETEPMIRAPRAGMGLHLRDVVSVAATILLGVGVLWPVLSTVQHRRTRSACAANMAGVGGALGMYSNDFRGALPVDQPLHAGVSWLNVGGNSGPSNSANLFTLAREHYAPVAQLACDGNPHAARELPEGSRDWRSSPEVSYSYFVMAQGRTPRWRSAASTVVLADRSPVALRAIAGEAISPEENSPNHAGSGQWALRLDGSAGWMPTPILQTATGPDNIWLPVTIEEALHNAGIVAKVSGAKHGAVVLPSEAQAHRQKMLRLFGIEVPGSPDDSFVGP